MAERKYEHVGSGGISMRQQRKARIPLTWDQFSSVIRAEAWVDPSDPCFETFRAYNIFCAPTINTDVWLSAISDVFPESEEGQDLPIYEIKLAGTIRNVPVLRTRKAVIAVSRTNLTATLTKIFRGEEYLDFGDLFNRNIAACDVVSETYDDNKWIVVSGVDIPTTPPYEEIPRLEYFRANFAEPRKRYFHRCVMD